MNVTAVDKSGSGLGFEESFRGIDFWTFSTLHHPNHASSFQVVYEDEASLLTAVTDKL